MDDAIRTLIRRKLRDGRLPLDSVSRCWGAPSDGEVCCDVCDKTITKQQIVLGGIASPSDKKPKPIHFHIRCFELWTNERRKPREMTASTFPPLIVPSPSRGAPPTDLESSDGRLSHVDCTQHRTLSLDERTLLFVYCADHVVAQCLQCGLSFCLAELAVDPLGGSGRVYQCPRCRKALTENLRTHLYGCVMLPAEVRRRAQAVREAAQHLVKESQQARDRSDVLMREAEAALFKSQRALREAMSRRAAS